MIYIKNIGGSLFTIFGIMFLFFTFFVYETDCASADSTLPSDYCYRQNITITNNKASDMSYKSIRLTKDTQTLINNNIINNTQNTFSLANPSLNNIEFAFANFNDVSSPLWIVPTNLNSNNSNIYSLYYGTNNHYRDSGIYFEGDSTATVGDSTDLQLTNNFNIIVDINPLNFATICPTTSTDSPVLINKLSGLDGYKINLYCSGGIIYVQSELRGGVGNSSVISQQLGTSYEGQNISIKIEKTSSEVNMYIAGIKVASDPALFSITTNNEPLLIGGTSLKGVVVRNVFLEDNANNLQKVTYTFDRLQETNSTSNQYTYNFYDSIGSNNGIFVKNYDSSGITFLFSNPDSNLVEFVSRVQDVSGSALKDVKVATSTNSFNPLNSVVEPVAQGFRLPEGVTYTIIFGFIGVIFAIGLNMANPNPLFSIIGFLIPISIGAISGFLPMAIFWLFLLIGLGGWGFTNWARNR